MPNHIDRFTPYHQPCHHQCHPRNRVFYKHAAAILASIILPKPSLFTKRQREITASDIAPRDNAIYIYLAPCGPATWRHRRHYRGESSQGRRITAPPKSVPLLITLLLAGPPSGGCFS